MKNYNEIKVGIAGLGAIGSAVARALLKGIPPYKLVAAADVKPNPEFDLPLLSFEELAETCDLVIECLPPSCVSELAHATLTKNKDTIIISSCSLLMFPEILEQHKKSKGRIIVPSGALAGLDGVRAMRQLGIKSATIASTKPPKGFGGAPYVVANKIDLAAITEKTRLFAGNALEAAEGFPANVNVAATLSLAGIGAQNTKVEIWADPAAKGNAHEIRVEGEYSTITARIENTPDPNNPKSSMLAAQSIVALLKGQSEPLVVL
jgi:aspartate dehydrogenase